ncbi:uncharacterized protein EI90DRAFT_3156523 [Cantharellus anzutake]|uniref:uncharacterized protein n=2 Tax=Cantharellus anzutake TaxID=1750568 RepID=UPI0019078B05|nr:uncharacterized protein EI90DRAFT_3156523 [Cantharellus anzutake]KAF8326592.1 hypothetical protein EI90DRAFT_3156523 [Cantharellus anzutake]
MSSDSNTQRCLRPRPNPKLTTSTAPDSTDDFFLIRRNAALPPPTSSAEPSAVPVAPLRPKRAAAHNSKKKVSPRRSNIPSPSTPSSKIVLKIPRRPRTHAELNAAPASLSLTTAGESSFCEPPSNPEAGEQVSGNHDAAGDSTCLDPQPKSTEAEPDAAPAPTALDERNLHKSQPNPESSEQVSSEPDTTGGPSCRGPLLNNFEASDQATHPVVSTGSLPSSTIADNTPLVGQTVNGEAGGFDDDSRELNLIGDPSGVNVNYPELEDVAAAKMDLINSFDDPEADVSPLVAGRYSKVEIKELDAIYQSFLISVNDWAESRHRTITSALNHISLAFATRERRASGNPWNAYLELNPNPDSSMRYDQYIQNIARPNYNKLTQDHGGKGSQGWQAKAQELIQLQDAKKRDSISMIRDDAKDQGGMIKRIVKSWKQDSVAARFAGIHMAMMILPSHKAASDMGTFESNSPHLHQFITSKLGKETTFIPELHSIISGVDAPATEAVGRDKLRSKCREYLCQIAEQASMPFKKNFQWNQFIARLIRQGKQLVNWRDNLPLAHVFSGEYLQKKTDTWEMLWTSCTGADNQPKLFIQSRPSGSDVIVVAVNEEAILSSGDAGVFLQKPKRTRKAATLVEDCEDGKKVAKRRRVGSECDRFAGSANGESFAPQEDRRVSSTSVSTLVAEEPLPSNAGLVGFPPISIHNPDIFASLPGPSNSQPAGTFHGMPYGLVSTPAIPPFSYPFIPHQHHFPPMMGMEVPGMSPSVPTADPRQSQTFFNFNHTNT